MKHIRHYESINESVLHNGIVLIKGKPRGKEKEKMLYAGHVLSSAELKPGVTMLFMSDQFYRIIKDGDRLKGVRINWRSEESLKDSLNLKSPGKITIVRNNNKTPYHWKTLKETSIAQALDRVRYDLGGSDYLFESENASTGYTISKKFITAAIDSIFKGGKSAMVVGWKADDALDLIDPDDDATTASHSASIDFVYIDPDLVEELKRLGMSTRCTLDLDLETTLTYSSWYDPGDYMNPPDGDTEINSASHEIEGISFSTFEIGDLTDSEIAKILKEISDALGNSEDVNEFLSSDSPVNHINFDKNFNL